MKQNLAICSAFVQFLTKQTGGNVALGVGGKLKILFDTIATLKGSVMAATSTAKEVAQTANEANTCATTTNTNTDAAKNAVNSIYLTNCSLKR